MVGRLARGTGQVLSNGRRQLCQRESQSREASYGQAEDELWKTIHTTYLHLRIKRANGPRGSFAGRRRVREDLTAQSLRYTVQGLRWGGVNSFTTIELEFHAN